MTFYNTISATGQQLIDFNSKSESLKETVYKLFLKENKSMTWSEVKNLIPEVNESSLKRSISDLKKEQKLEKTNELVLSIYKTPSHRYRLKV